MYKSRCSMYVNALYVSLSVIMVIDGVNSSCS